MYHPSRGGVRGGSDQFEWESVKIDKHRENYLGHSLMAPVGRWQKKKDLQWFSREKKSSAKTRDEEKEAIRRMEAEAMAAALGKGPVKKAHMQLTKQELEEVCRKGQTERDDKDIERIEGMGFGSSRASLMDNLKPETNETLSAIGSTQESTGKSMESKDSSQQKDSQEERRKKRKSVKKEKRTHKKSKKKSKKHPNRHDSDSDHHHKHREKSHPEDNTNNKTKRPRHDSTSDSESGNHDHNRDRHSRNMPRKRHDSSSGDESHTKRKQRGDDYKNKTKYSSHKT